MPSIKWRRCRILKFIITELLEFDVDRMIYLMKHLLQTIYFYIVLFLLLRFLQSVNYYINTENAKNVN